MQKLNNYYRQIGLSFAFAIAAVGAGCQPQAENSNTNRAAANTPPVNADSNSSNKTGNLNANSAVVPSVVIETKEPEQYQATVKMTFQATGNQQTTQLPAISAQVARNAENRMMELTLPNGEKIVYIDKNGTNYAILPSRRQYAELTKETLGFDVRRLLMPEQIVQQVKQLKGFNLIGEENANGRQVVKYGYQSVNDTQSQAGNVATQSFILIDKETGLPLHSETVSQSQSGGNVQGYNGLRLSTEMTDIKTNVDAAIFNVPTDYQKIDDQQIKAQADLIFKIAGNFLAQMMQQGQAANSNTAANSAVNSANSSANQGK